ncbi:MAG: rRNA (adenine1518-N6/adenine1519-N6)-dimethyltransferase [Thermoleophilaceae bacterium]|nr:rRNA (adenine1518-N6/adenine1519-N6)-dimethyltransferase [Thermoleophilaceae bacterium]
MDTAAEPGPGQASRRRMREFDIRPNRELGQNFLVDDNVLEVIGRAAELDLADTVLEVGGGLGVLSEYLAPRVGHLHVVELDERLRPPLEQALGPFPNATLHMADAVKLDLAALDPTPDKVVANLPYGVAATVLIRTIRESPQIGMWVAMVQREVADRLAAPPGSRTYGATSAIAQLACQVKLLRPVGAGVFLPRPRVGSALVLMRRNGPPPGDPVVALIHGAFGHRRKALGGSLALAAGAPEGLRERARDALVAMGLPADSRAERLSASQFAELADVLGDALLAPLVAAGVAR